LQHDEKEVKGMMAPGAAGGLFLIAAGFFYHRYTYSFFSKTGKIKIN
jgi:hypothetical protein